LSHVAVAVLTCMSLCVSVGVLLLSKHLRKRERTGRLHPVCCDGNELRQCRHDANRCMFYWHVLVWMTVTQVTWQTNMLTMNA